MTAHSPHSATPSAHPPDAASHGPQAVRVSTAHVPVQEQYAFWRDGFNEPILGISGEPVAQVGCGFRAEVDGWITPSLQCFRHASDNQKLWRGKREIARRPWDAVWIYRERDVGAWFDLAGRELTTVAGDFVIADADLPFTSRANREHRQDVWLLPKPLLVPHLPAASGPLSTQFNGGSGVAAVLAAYLQVLGEQVATLPMPQVDAMADNLARLVAIACGAAQGEHEQATQAALLQRAKRYIAHHLPEPALSPATAAAALGVSERKLYLAFASNDTSFAELVTRLRLAECHAALSSPLAARRSVPDIAFGWGFRSLATFYRAFRRQYGLAPGDVRATDVGSQ